MEIVLSALIVLVLMIGMPSVQAFHGASKDGYDAGYFAAKAAGYDFGYRDGI